MSCDRFFFRIESAISVEDYVPVGICLFQSRGENKATPIRFRALRGFCGLAIAAPTCESSFFIS
jgi:hypothetical protein